MSPVSWGDIFTLPLRGDRIMELRHLRPLALRSESRLRILASRPIFGPGGWVARPRPPFWPHFSRLRDSYRRTTLYSRPLHELSWQRRILHASHACTGRDECLPERRSAF